MAMHLDKQTLEWLKEILPHITLKGRSLTREQRSTFLTTGKLPEGADYPEILDPANWQKPAIQALFYAGTARGKGVASGPYAVATGTENFFARQIRPK